MDGGEKFTLKVVDLASGEEVGEVVKNIDYCLAWAGDSETLFYCTRDSTERSDKVWRIRAGAPAASASLVFHEPDDMFSTSVSGSNSGEVMWIDTGSSITSDVQFVAASDPEGEWKHVMPRQHVGTETLDPYLGRNGGIRHGRMRGMAE